MTSWKLMCLLLVLLLTGTVLTACSGNFVTGNTPKASEPATSSRANRIGTSLGDTAPDFELTAMDGSRLKRSDLNGQPVVLIFWSAWCPVCKEEAPQFNKLAAQFATRQVRVIGVNIKDSVARTHAGIKEFGIQYTVARDPEASVTRRFNVTGTPTIIFLDHAGIVRYFGNELPVDYSSRIEMMLEQKS